MLPDLCARQGLFLGIDLGTSGIRIAAIDQNDRVRAMIARAWPPQGAMDPGVWNRMTQDLLARLLRRIDRTQVRALAVDGTSGTVMLCGSCGAPRGRALAYDDDRAHEEAKRVAAVAPSSAAAGAAGGPAKLLWLRARRLGAHRALTQAGFVSGCLTGRYTTCDEHNALKLGADGRRWPQWLRTLGLTGLLPRIAAPGTPIGRLSPGLCRRLGLPQAPWVMAGTTDSTAGILALGPLPAGTAVTTLGSTLVVKIVSRVPVDVPDMGIYSHRLGRSWLIGGASNSGGRVLRHFFSVGEIERLSAHLPLPHPTGLSYYPLLRAGERFPVCDPQWPPRLTPRPADDAIFLQGLMEGLAAIERLSYETLAAKGAPYPARVITLGGGAGNRAWQVIRAGALGAPITTARVSAAAGTARLAHQGLRSSCREERPPQRRYDRPARTGGKKQGRRGRDR